MLYLNFYKNISLIHIEMAAVRGDDLDVGSGVGPPWCCEIAGL